MTTKRLPPNAGMGRIKGVPNVATKNARLAIAAFVDSNHERLNHLLQEIERKHGALVAWDCVMRLIERHMPRLQFSARQENERGRAAKNCKSTDG
jgi:hypothetical protein